MGLNDGWASNFRVPTMPLSESEVRDLFVEFDIVTFIERDENAKTSLGKM
ncbi:hypothetical protein [Marinomonas mediterranea]|nr:hypothetical protein [Marinomonas mediterranea]